MSFIHAQILFHFFSVNYWIQYYKHACFKKRTISCNLLKFVEMLWTLAEYRDRGPKYLITMKTKLKYFICLFKKIVSWFAANILIKRISEKFLKISKNYWKTCMFNCTFNKAGSCRPTVCYSGFFLPKKQLYLILYAAWCSMMQEPFTDVLQNKCF